MTPTFIQSAFEWAKIEPESPAFVMTYGGEHHEIPWWMVKSKVKHFGLGLLAMGAKPGEHFYLLPDFHLNWIYAELAALTVGLQTLPIPGEIHGSELEGLLEAFPPAFFYAGNGISSSMASLFTRQKHLRGLVFPEEDKENSKKWPHLATTFRKIFNSGIINESKYILEFHKQRDEIHMSGIISPIQVEKGDRLTHRPLSFEKVHQVSLQLNNIFPLKKAKKFLVEADLSHTLQRIVAVYWPVSQGAEIIYGNPDINLSGQFLETSPSLAFLPISSVENLLNDLIKMKDADISKKTNSGPKRLWNRFQSRKKIKRILGPRLQKILTLQSLEPSLKNLLRLGKVQPVSLPEEFLKTL